MARDYSDAVHHSYRQTMPTSMPALPQYIAPAAAPSIQTAAMIGTGRLIPGSARPEQRRQAPSTPSGVSLSRFMSALEENARVQRTTGGHIVRDSKGKPVYKPPEKYGHFCAAAVSHSLRACGFGDEVRGNPAVLKRAMEKSGFREVSLNGGDPEIGDVAIITGDGVQHACAWDGKKWISDAYQRRTNTPNPYASGKGNIAILRHPDFAQQAPGLRADKMMLAEAGRHPASAVAQAPRMMV